VLLAGSVHKWLHGAHGFSLLYVDPNVQPQLAPLEHHERNRGFGNRSLGRRRGNISCRKEGRRGVAVCQPYAKYMEGGWRERERERERERFC
jgi:selenocysteine lyase/cysteine desulfurase